MAQSETTPQLAVVPYSDLEANVARPQPGQSNGRSQHENVNPMPPTTTTTASSSSSSSSSTAPRLTSQVPSYWREPTAAMQQWYTDQAGRWYYYYPPSPGPTHPPNTTPSGTASVSTPDAMLGPISTSLKALQSQFTAFQVDLGGVKSDVKNALFELYTLRTAQTKAGKDIEELKGVIGVGSAGARSKGRGKRAGGRGRGSNPGTTTESFPEAVDGAGAGSVPEKTLTQTLASIQSAIETLLAHDSYASQTHLPEIHRQESQSPLFQRVVDPAQQPMQFTLRVSPTSQPESSPPLSSNVIHTPEFGTSLLAIPEKEYTDASIQARPPSLPSEPSSNSPGHTPGLIPADWSVHPGPVRPTAFTAECLARFLLDTHLPSTQNTPSETQIPRRDDDRPLCGSVITDTHLPLRAASGPVSSPYPSETSTTTQRADPPAAPSSLDNSVAPLVSGTTPATETPPPARISTQSSHPQVQSAPSIPSRERAEPLSAPSQKPPGGLQLPFPLNSPCFPSRENVSIQSSWRLRVQAHSLTTEDSPNDSQTPSSSLSSTHDTSVPDSGASGGHVDHPGRIFAELDSGDAQRTAMSVTSGVNPTHAISGYDRRPLPIEADEDELLPTPPSEAVVDDLVSGSTHEHGAVTDPKLTLRTLPRNLPIIPTPPLWTPEPSVAGDGGMLSVTGGGSARQGSLGAVSELPLPSTPSLFSPLSVVIRSLAEEGVNAHTRVHKVTKEHPGSPNDAGGVVVDVADPTEGINTNALMDDARSSPQMSQAGVEVSTMPHITLSNALPPAVATSNEGSSQVPRASEEVDVYGAHRSSLDQTSVTSPERHPGANEDDVDPMYSLLQAYGQGYDFHFSSPLRRDSPPTSSTPSRYTTPFEFSEMRPTQDEDEVWRVLMPHGSGLSTPTSLPMMFSHEPSRASSVQPDSLASEPLSVDPSVLQLRSDPPSPVPETSPPRFPDRSLSPLTSIGDTDVGQDGDDDAGETPRTYVAAKTYSRSNNSSGSNRDRRLEPIRSPSLTSHASASTIRAASGATMSSSVDGHDGSGRPMGGPSASLDELAMLARKAPFKVLKVKVPKATRGVKRKRDDEGDDDGGGEGMSDGNGDSDGEGRMNDDLDETIHGDMQTTPVETESSALDTCIPTQPVSRPALEKSARSGLDMPSDLPAPRHGVEKEGKRSHKKRKLVDLEYAVTYRIRDGQIVAGPQTEPGSPPPATSTLSHSEKVDEDARAPPQMRHRKERENRTTKTPLSEPAKSSSSGSRHVTSLPTKEDVQKRLSRGAGIWPEPPTLFSQWDVQFIQCDSCDKWYHYGCVAVESGDPRLEPDALFICPTCHIQRPKRKTARHGGNACARSDCPEPLVTAESELFFVERLVGRKKVEGYIYMWLAKWEGYPMSEATWIPKENLVGGDTKLFNAFLEDATEEGADLSKDVVLLQEALDAGWGSEAC